MFISTALLLAGPLLFALQDTATEPSFDPKFVDATAAMGLGADVIPETVARVLFCDVNSDGMADVVVNRHRVFLNVASESKDGARLFEEVRAEDTGLAKPGRSTLTVFADFDNDGFPDAFVTQYFESTEGGASDAPATAWQKGRGDGTFEPPQEIAGLPSASTSAIAVADINRDGRLDVFLGNWYVRYGGSYLGYPNDLLFGSAAEGAPFPIGSSLPADSKRVFDTKEELPEVQIKTDPDGRPTYGAMVADLDGSGAPELIELNYGRRWNRIWRLDSDGAHWSDVGGKSGFDADSIRHGKYPDWAIDAFARREPPIEREPEAPFRSNGNTFDCSVGDIDNDGDFDILLTTIAHAWAGSSSDRSRILIQGEPLAFSASTTLNMDRLPEAPTTGNQGDLFGELADLDQDGNLDVLLSSGDYPDNQRLRVYLQKELGKLVDQTAQLSVDHDGSQQLSVADVDGDGDLDIIVGQTFNRFTKEQREGRAPALKLLLNESTASHKSVTLRLHGDGVHTNRDALGAIVEAKLSDGRTLTRQLIGIGGHAGKQRSFLIHFGLGEAKQVDKLTVTWPNSKRSQVTLPNVAPGRYSLVEGGKLEQSPR